MKLIDMLTGRRPFSKEERNKTVSLLRKRYNHFRTILDGNINALKLIGDMEEKSQGEYIFDINYIRRSFDSIKLETDKIVDNLIKLGGSNYLNLKIRYNDIIREIIIILDNKSIKLSGPSILSMEEVDKSYSNIIGSKNANLGELKNKLGVNIPDGFVIATQAYLTFLETGELKDKISAMIRNIDIKDYHTLNTVANSIYELIMNTPLPPALSTEIFAAAEGLKDKIINKEPAGNHDTLLALRSSAIGEDSALSFAGQYTSILGIRPEEIVKSYKQVVASKFSPRAIYYYMSHSLDEESLPMSAGCYRMVDARAAGVIYTKDPVVPGSNVMIISSVHGLGKPLVDGTVNPDVYRIDRVKHVVLEKKIAEKEYSLELDNYFGIILKELHGDKKSNSSISDEEAVYLTEIALRIENYFEHPQDIEWAIDKSGSIFILQSRPLRCVKEKPKYEIGDVLNLDILVKCGETACPGAGFGKTFNIRKPGDIINIPDGSVVVASLPYPELITVFPKIRALICSSGSIASHMVTIARESRIPTILCVSVNDKLTDGEEVTVDATNCIIYKGSHPALVDALKPEFELFEDQAIFKALESITAKMSPLNLALPSSPDFQAENCLTLHDVIRFAHQKAMEEMFEGIAGDNSSPEKIIEFAAIPLKSSIPLKVDLINIDEEDAITSKRYINDHELKSLPLKAYWKGMLEEGWQAPPVPEDPSGFFTVISKDLTSQNLPKLAGKSYVVVSREYMILSLNMGYHFMTVESLVTANPAINYIKMSYKEGGASLERRLRRIAILKDILAQFGFRNIVKGDFIESYFDLETADATLEKLFILGRITMLTRQLDMALSDNETAQEYKSSILNKLLDR